MESKINYVEVFDITHARFQGWWIIGIPLVLTVVFARLVIVERRRHTGPFSLPMWMHWILPGFPLTAMLFMIGSLSVAQARLESAYRHGRVTYVEGQVANFETNAKVEWFDVNGKHFEYSPYVLQPGFNRTAARGGPIRPHLQVRIGYIGDTIVWLGVANDVVP